MAARDTGTEQLIKDTAKRVFFAEGRLHATTQDIADAAGVNRTLVNYYFRSKDILIEKVFKEAMQDLSTRLDKVMESDLPFNKKIENFIEVFLTEAVAFPYQETFLVTEMLNDANKCDEKKPQKIKSFLAQIQAEMDAGNIKQMNPIHFMMNLFSLMVYPLIMSPLYKQLFNLSSNNFNELIQERKKLICETILQ
ncbi:TetR/AcrR family transcriptional regulator [Mucilaginibacter lacusdianchii]|uniref:TetR/AcrR family transcriptional regulator n=1 Tax=Mucilaginibacter lacusdianchii TaxID=2684211 RepID=UPI00131E5A04|nr:TetR/AcrR family transcriptional regulator [Mucilaginibacter sp. JXJ CY 39]